MDNVLSILHWESEKLLNLLRQPVDKEKWTTEPAVVNAFYNPNKNDIGERLFLFITIIHMHISIYFFIFYIRGFNIS